MVTVEEAVEATSCAPAGIGTDFDIVTVSGELPLNELEDILSLARKENYRNFIGWGGGSLKDALEYFKCRK